MEGCLVVTEWRSLADGQCSLTGFGRHVGKRPRQKTRLDNSESRRMHASLTRSMSPRHSRVARAPTLVRLAREGSELRLLEIIPPPKATSTAVRQADRRPRRFLGVTIFRCCFAPPRKMEVTSLRSPQAAEWSRQETSQGICADIMHCVLLWSVRCVLTLRS
jgi:hypothetical protein